MIQRALSQQIDALLKEFPAVALLGPRQVGKTTLVKKLMSRSKKTVLYFDLEDDKDLARLNDPGFVFDQFPDHCIILDEVQRMPELFTILRPSIDKNRRPGRFILTGSASPHLVKGVSESLAGRIAFSELAPINLIEANRSRISQIRHWFRGGFPVALTAKSDEVSIRWTENFIRSYIERDLSLLFGTNLSERTTRNFMYMLASQNGGIWNADHFARALGVSATTVQRYLHYFEGAFLTRQLQPWFVNVQKRIVKAPKIYFRDSGVLHMLNRIHSKEQLPLDLAIGASWEGYVIEQAFQLKPANTDIYYYRTHQGAECDLILVRGIKPILAIKIKYSSKPNLEKGFYTALNDLNLDKGFVVVPGNVDYAINEKVRCTGLLHFLTQILPHI